MDFDPHSNWTVDILEKVADILIQVGRSQFVAVLGNVSVALPVAFLVSWVVLSLSGTPLLSRRARRRARYPSRWRQGS
ncbi:hypothetical protein [Ectothiorhodospira magna]|uniref:hypothetical protein n=1 Tax=Ectothiorhodospira magna TaxID=867345 RepID=UPI000B7F3E22